MIWVSRVTARFELPDGLRLPRSRLRPSPKPMAAEGAPTARMREQTTAALAEGRKDFMIYETRSAQRSCAHARSLSGAYPPAGCFDGFTETGTLKSSAVRMIRVCSTVCAAGY